MQIHLKKGERLYINGAVLRVSQRCSLELLNNVSFLLENHVMQPEEATTPFKQLYFVVQTMLIDPENALITRELYWHQSERLARMLNNQDLKNHLKNIDVLIHTQRIFEALKTIRNLYALEQQVLSPEFEYTKAS